MNELNRYFSYQLEFFRGMSLRKLKKKGQDPEEQSFLSYFFKIYQQNTAYLKEGLANRNEGLEEMRQGLIDYFTQQLAAFNTAKESAREVDAGDPVVTLQIISRIYWAAAMCICSGGRFTAPQPVIHLDIISNTIARRIVAQVLTKLKKEQFNTHLDFAIFFERYTSFEDQSIMERWRRLLYRTVLPVW